MSFVHFLLGLCCGLVIGTAVNILHAQDLDGVVYSQWYEGELAPTSQPSQAGGVGASLPSTSSVSPHLERLADCIIWRESRGYADAVNPRSGASGLGQFLPSTWRTTPQGRAGYSVFDPAANRQAVIWMLSVGRGREFATIGGC